MLSAIGAGIGAAFFIVVAVGVARGLSVRRTRLTDRAMRDYVRRAY